MKSYVVLVIIAVSVAAATALHAYKTKQPAELDKIDRALNGGHSILPEDSRISFQGEPSRSELLAWARFAMVPRYINAAHQYDTTLVIRYKTNSDSSLLRWESSRRMLWQSADSVYHYSLTTAH